MKTIERSKMEKSKRRIDERLGAPPAIGSPTPVIGGGNIRYEVGEKTKAISHGGIGLVMGLIEEIGLAEKIDERLHLFKIHAPYHESDHVIAVALNGLCGGTTLDDLELLRQDEVFLDALGADRIPDPTTVGDFCRRFDEARILDLMDAINRARLQVWKRQPKEFLERATLDVDGTLCATTGCCKEGMEFSYKGVCWGYHPLVVSLANTGEVLFLQNRPGNRPSHEGAWWFLDDAIDLVERAGFRKILLRGDTDFSQCHKLDDWNARNVSFVFGFDATPTLCEIAENLPQSAWSKLQRRDKHPRQGKSRSRPENVKERIVIERQFENIRTVCEEIAEFQYRPGKCQREYRIVVVKKNLTVEKGENHLFDDVRYFFYITNLTGEAEEVVWEANDRCNQENHIEQLKNGIRALHAPVNSLLANWAYMVMMALGWNLKIWLALRLPAGRGNRSKKHRAEKRTLLRMEFKRFANAIINIPCQILRTGRRIVYRILSWNPWQPVFYRLARVLRQ